MTASHDLASGRCPSRTRQLAQAHLRPVKSCGWLVKRLVYRWKGLLGLQVEVKYIVSVAQVVLFVRVLSAASNANIIMLVKRTSCGGMK